MSMKFTRNALAVASAAMLLASMAPVARSADHREAPLINFRATDTTARCPETLHLPIRASVEVPGYVLRGTTIPVNFITRGVDGDVDASDYVVWQRNMGTTFSTVLNPSIVQSSEVFLAFPAGGSADYEVKFVFESIPDGDACELSGKIVYGLKPVQVVSIHIEI